MMTPFFHARLLAVLTALFPFSALPSTAQTVDLMTLSVTPLAEETVVLDLAALDALDQVEFTTSTIWTDSENLFSGVPLKALLAHLDVEGTTIEMVALNDYAVSMPIADLEDDAPIVASRMDGKTMSVRDKGPFWLVYPYDRDDRYSTETNYSRSIWQLNRLKVLD